jgi:hypothetical protein
MSSAQGPPGTAQPGDGEACGHWAGEIRKLQAGRGQCIGAIEGGVVHQVRHKRPYPSRGCWRERSGQQRQHEDVPELQRSQGIERWNRRDECRSGQVVVAHHQPRLVAIQQAPEDRPGDDAGEVEAEDGEAHRRTRASQLQHEPEQGDDGELVPEIRDAQPQPKPLERAMAQWSANSSRLIAFYSYVLSLEYPQTLSSSI